MTDNPFGKLLEAKQEKRLQRERMKEREVRQQTSEYKGAAAKAADIDSDVNNKE